LRLRLQVLNEKDVNVLAISLDSAIATRKFVLEKKPNFPIYWSNDDEFKKQFKAYVTPQTVLVDESGTVVENWKGILSTEHQLKIKSNFTVCIFYGFSSLSYKTNTLIESQLPCCNLAMCNDMPCSSWSGAELKPYCYPGVTITCLECISLSARGKVCADPKYTCCVVDEDTIFCGWVFETR
jgi:hypothetical protein